VVGAIGERVVHIAREDNMSNVEGKVVVITGASSGIGEATALLLAEHGATVVLGARRSDRLETLADRVTQAGGAAAYATTDVTRREDLVALVALARDRFGKLDVLINNAGIGPNAPFDDLRVEEWTQMIDINVKGVLYGIAAALPVFREQGAGHVINTASTAAFLVRPNMAVYAATKSAVRAISEGLRQEAGDKLRVTVVCPGFVHTDFVNGSANEQMRAQLSKARDAMAIPPSAIAGAMLYAIEQPSNVDVGEIVVRPTAQA
jgi:NADP-dependent 3-hydroxy acid dehydrogenase YdfG